MKYNVIPQIKHIKLNDGLSHFVNFYVCIILLDMFNTTDST